MKLIFVLCAVILVQYATAKSALNDEEDERWACVEGVFRELEADPERLGHLALEFFNMVSESRAGRQRCYDMLSDPPTELERRRHEACMIAWRATLLRDVNRLRRAAQDSDVQETFEQLQRDIMDCLDATSDEIID
ncbi:uncharacterized protein LOC132265875 [Phlebotomus argentipes]|uniref:uncharacterized protein LOC132265875 n=1 Tax=Phlebotomus argentipes TaxID=94469 RepID=UPI0028934EC3|nr:uncharacterized protein LOC132265875 [Phlebotomus argentipes]